MLYLIVAGVAVALGYRYWPDICANIVETGLRRPAPVEPSAVEKFHAVADVAAKPDPTLAGLAAALKAKS